MYTWTHNLVDKFPVSPFFYLTNILVCLLEKLIHIYFFFEVMHIQFAVQILFYVSWNGCKQATVIIQTFTCAFIHRKFYLSGNTLEEILCSVIFWRGETLKKFCLILLNWLMGLLKQCLSIEITCTRKQKLGMSLSPSVSSQSILAFRK